MIEAVIQKLAVVCPSLRNLSMIDAWWTHSASSP
jgi:hypothetical protein